MTFTVGETVVYPNHGAAVIEDIEMRTIKGEDRQYLVLRIVAQQDLVVRVPACNLDLVGVRDVVDKEGLDRVFDVQPDSDTPANVVQARALLREVDAGAGVLVLTDAFGASPGNVASQLAEPGRVAVIAGVNLPMLLRALCYREGSLAETTEKALAGGTQGVMQVASTAVQQQGLRPAAGDDLARLHHQQ